MSPFQPQKASSAALLIFSRFPLKKCGRCSRCPLRAARTRPYWSQPSSCAARELPTVVVSLFASSAISCFLVIVIGSLQQVRNLPMVINYRGFQDIQFQVVPMDLEMQIKPLFFELDDFFDALVDGGLVGFFRG